MYHLNTGDIGVNRYNQLIELVEERQPKRILEIGTWNGHRAVEMLEVSPLAHYYGFDLFEDATKETDAQEFNVKKHHSIQEVSDYMMQFFPTQFELYKGDSKETLNDFHTDFIDFAFIDGGHSRETIKSDIRNVVRLIREGSQEAVVILDDYYTGVKGMDFGVLDSDLLYLHQQGGAVKILPMRDGVVGGGRVQLVKVMFDERT